MDLQPVIVADLLADLLAAASGAHFSVGGTQPIDPRTQRPGLAQLSQRRFTMPPSAPGWRGFRASRSLPPCLNPPFAPRERSSTFPPRPLDHPIAFRGKLLSPLRVTRASSLDLSPRFKELSMANARPNRSRASRDPSPDSLLERSFSPARSSGLRSSFELETSHSTHFPDHFRFIQAPTILASPFPRRYFEDPTSGSTSSSLDARDARDHWSDLLDPINRKVTTSFSRITDSLYIRSVFLACYTRRRRFDDRLTTLSRRHCRGMDIPEEKLCYQGKAFGLPLVGSSVLPAPPVIPLARDRETTRYRWWR